MFTFIDKIPYIVLIIIALVMLLAPFQPMPHVIEKLLMLKEGALKKPIDIFDLVNLRPDCGLLRSCHF